MTRYETFIRQFKNKQEYDSGAVAARNKKGELNVIGGIRANFGNYEFTRDQTPNPQVNYKSYATPVTEAPKPGLFRMIRDGKNRVAF
jgi:hypothetical protein